MNTRESNQIKPDIKPHYFKFYSLSKFGHLTIENLRENRIYAQSIFNLNDPFEGLWYDCDTNHLESAHNREFRNRLGRSGIFSLCCSEDKYFPMNPESILLWSHYADGHKGFCIEFSEKILNHDEFEFTPSMVKYTDALPDKDSIYPYDEYSVKDKERILYCKGQMWNYENELRLCFNKANEYVEIPKGCIKAIYCGCKMSTEEIEIMKNLAKYLSVELHVLGMALDKYKFEEQI